MNESINKMRLIILSGVNEMGVIPNWARFFSEDMKWGFEQLGWNVKLLVAKGIEHFQQSVDEYKPNLILTLGSPMLYVDECRPDLIVTMDSPTLYGDNLVLQHIGKRSANCGYKYIHWDTDSITWKNIELGLIKITQPDMTFTVCPDMLRVLANNGIKAKRADYGFNPQRQYKREQVRRYKNMITLVARYYEANIIPEHTRRKSIYVLAESLLNNGYIIDLWSDVHWINYSEVSEDIPGKYIYHGNLDYSNVGDVYSSCNLNLIIQNSINSLSQRTYEILASGGFAISYDTPEVRRVFVPDKEIIVASNEEEMISKVKYYSTHLEERNEIISNGLEAVKNHDYKMRAKSMVDSIIEKSS